MYVRGYRQLQTDHGSQHLAASGKNHLPNVITKSSPKFNRTIISHEDKNFIWNKFELLFSQIAGNADISVTYINFLAERISHPVVKAIMKFRSYPSVFKDKKNRMLFFFFLKAAFVTS